MSTTSAPRIAKAPFEIHNEDGYYNAYRTLAEARMACDRLAAKGQQAYVYRSADMEVVYDPCAD